MAARMLTLLGHEVIEAGSGAEAEQVFRGGAGDVDALVVDFFLGDHSGPTLVQRLESIAGRPLSVVFISGDSEAGRNAPAAGGPRQFVVKPFSAADLELALRAVAGA